MEHYALTEAHVLPTSCPEMELFSSLKIQEIAKPVPPNPFKAMQLNNLFRELWYPICTCIKNMFLFASKFSKVLFPWRMGRKTQSGHQLSFFTVQLIKLSSPVLSFDFLLC